MNCPKCNKPSIALMLNPSRKLCGVCEKEAKEQALAALKAGGVK